MAKQGLVCVVLLDLTLSLGFGLWSLLCVPFPRGFFS
jgi:hypothetical protein